MHILSFLNTFLLFQVALCTPSMLGDVGRTMAPKVKQSVLQAVSSAIDETSLNIQADSLDFIFSNMAWVPASLKMQMRAFIQNKLMARLTNDVKALVKEKSLPKVAVVVDAIAEQVMLLDKDIDRAILDIRNNFRKNAQLPLVAIPSARQHPASHPVL